MKLLKYIFLFFILNTSYAQTLQIVELEDKNQALKNNIKEIKENKKNKEEQLEIETKNLNSSQEKVKRLNKEWSELPELQKETLKRLKSDIKDRLNKTKTSFKDNLKNLVNPGNKKSFLKYKKYIKCLDKVLNVNTFYKKGILNQCDKHKDKAASYAEATKLIEALNKDEIILNKSKSLLKKRLAEERKKNWNIEKEVNKYTRDIKNLERDLEKKVSEKEQNIKDIQEEKLSIKFKDFYTCDASTPTLDLEKEKVSDKLDIPGPFHKIARDNQDGIGSCFANTAKNLLAGLTGGQEDASFLDMALQYKAQDGKDLYDLDGGHSCTVLKEIKKNGYCPKRYSSVENGEPINSIGGIVGERKDVSSQSRVLDMMGNYLKGKSLLEKNSDDISKKLLKNSQKMIQAIKNNPNIKLPYPSIQNFPFDSLTAESMYLWSYKNKIENSNETKDVKEEIIPQKDFMNEYEDIVPKFTNEYLLAVKSGQSLEKREKLFDKHFSKFSKKYNLEERLNSVWSVGQFKKFHESNQQADLKSQFDATLNFYKEFVDSKVTEETLGNLFNSTCYTEASEYSTFVGGLKTLTDFFKKSNISTDLLYDSEGNSLSNKDILQLAVAPKCLNEKNRKKLDFDFTCDLENKYQYKDLDEKTKNKIFNKKLVMSLAQGLPVGNTYHTGTGWHINTIVGYRFNPENSKCEYKIRESQNGSFYWSDSTKILNTMSSLTFVGRKDEIE